MKQRLPFAPLFTRRAVGALAVLVVVQARGVELDWNNTGTDLGAAASYTQGTAPVASSALYFKVPPGTQPTTGAALTIAGFNFSAAGFNVTSTGGAALTLNGYGTSATGTSASNAASVYSSAAGVTIFDAPVILASTSAGAAPSTIYQAGAGGSLIFNGAISGSSNVALNVAATSTVAFNSANSALTGNVTITGTNVTGGPATLALGADTALGSGALIFNSSNATVAAAGGTRTIANALSLAGPGVIGGTNNFVFTGTTTASGALTRILTVNNTATTTFAGNVYLSESATVGRNLTLSGTGAVRITGTIANFNGAGTAGSLTYNGTGMLTLSSANTYTGNTTVAGGTLVAAANGALGSGNVSVLASATKLTIAAGVTNPFGNPAGTLSLAGGGAAGADVGYLDLTSGANITVGTLVLGTTTFTSGTFSSATSSDYILGGGVITVVPEPATYAYILGAFGVMGLVLRRRRQVA